MYEKWQKNYIISWLTNQDDAILSLLGWDCSLYFYSMHHSTWYTDLFAMDITLKSTSLYSLTCSRALLQIPFNTVFREYLDRTRNQFSQESVAKYFPSYQLVFSPGISRVISITAVCPNYFVLKQVDFSLSQGLWGRLYSKNYETTKILIAFISVISSFIFFVLKV